MAGKTPVCYDEFARLISSRGSSETEAEADTVLYDGLDRRDFRHKGGAFREYHYIGMSQLLSRERPNFTEANVSVYDYDDQRGGLN